MKLSRITIDQLTKIGGDKITNFEGKVLISDHLGQSRLFEEPCRIDAVTIIVCLRGRMEYEVNLSHYELTANSILVNMPENIVQLGHFEDLDAYIILISTEFIKGMPMEMFQKAMSTVSVAKHCLVQVPGHLIRGLRPYYDLIQSSLLRVIPETEEIARGLLQSFGFSIIGLLKEFGKVDESLFDRRASRSSRTLFDRFMSVLAQCHQQERTVQFYADELCVSPKYLSTVIREYSGKTPSDWIADYVIAEAKSLLHYSSLTAQEVAFRLNFPSQSAFGKFFKQQTGMSPMQYAKPNMD